MIETVEPDITVQPLMAPNTSFHYLRAGDTPTRILCRIVLRGSCTDEHDERIRRALAEERFFPSAVVGGDSDGPESWCEMVALTPTLASPTDDRDVGELVRQLEATALNGWRREAPKCNAPRAPSQ